MSPLKPAILLSSVLLAAAFIYYRVHLAAPVSAAAPAPSTSPAAAATILPSSKYALVAQPPSPNAPSPAPATQPALPETVNITVNDPSGGGPVTLSVPLMLLVGSKSAPVFTPEQIEKYRVKTPAPPVSQPPAVILSGSKSAAVFTPPPTTTPTNAPTPPPPAALMSSSKVIVLTPDINFSPPATQPAAQAVIILPATQPATLPSR